MSIALDLDVSVAAPDYSGLIALIGDYLDRADLTARIPTFIELATRRFNRTLWVPERQVSVEVPVAGEYRLPGGFYQIRAIFVADGDDTPLGQVSVDTIKAAREVTGRPTRYAIFGDILLFDPQVDKAYVVTISYYEAIPPLGSFNTSNWLLEKHPDAYLYGALVQAEAMLGNDERTLLWKSALDEVLDEIARTGLRQLHSGGPLVMRTSARP